MDLARQLAGWQQWHTILVFAATVAFAVTGVLAVTEEKDTDLLGALFFGVITGIGGGTIRDAILGVRPFWYSQQWYVGVAAAAAIIAFYVRRRVRGLWIESALTYLDGLGAAMFAVEATALVWVHNFARPSGPILLGVVTALGGGLLRDILAGRPTLLMRPELYATPVVLGAAASTLVLQFAPRLWTTASILCIAATFAFRAAAIHWHWRLPGWARSSPSPPP